MPVDEAIRRRVLGIHAGTVEPETGMEKHFRRVCLGEAIPVTAEEREWHQLVAEGGAEGEEPRARSLADAEVRIAGLEHRLAMLEEESAARHRAETALEDSLARLAMAESELRVRRLEAQAFKILATQGRPEGAVVILGQEEVAHRLNADDRRALSQYGFLKSLSDGKGLPPALAEELMAVTGLSIAMHNVEKMLRVLKDGAVQEFPLRTMPRTAQEAKCNACDRPLSFCICGR